MVMKIWISKIFDKSLKILACRLHSTSTWRGLKSGFQSDDKMREIKHHYFINSLQFTDGRFIIGQNNL